MAEDNIGWIESIDPTSGRTFYANRYTRTTQWDPPPGWKKQNTTTDITPATAPSPVASRNSHSNSASDGHTNGNGNVVSDIARARRQMEEEAVSSSNSHDPNGGQQHHTQPSRASSFHHRQQQQQQQQTTRDDPNSLPDGWEEMTDPTTGRKFYIDHASKITTWERPTERSSNSSNISSSSSSSNPSTTITATPPFTTNKIERTNC
mmetsp:Transcript_11303/g.21357  ORF Transcript_11303/g.21357 Transcript_11303/m.21357 type:complete len:206 (+) Transcript_11303:204-821(+)